MRNSGEPSTSVATVVSEAKGNPEFAIERGERTGADGPQQVLSQPDTVEFFGAGAGDCTVTFVSSLASWH